MKSLGQVAYEAMLEQWRVTHPAYEFSGPKPDGISDAEWQSAKDYAAGKWEEQPQGLRDDWEAVASAVEKAVRSR